MRPADRRIITSMAAASTLGLHMGQTINPDLYDWFLEPAQND